MAFCTECGAKLPNGALFCPNCGTALKAEAVEENDKNDAEAVKDGDVAEAEADNENPEQNASASSRDAASEPKTVYYNVPDTSGLGYPQQGEQAPKKVNGAVIAIIVIASVLLLVAVGLFVFLNNGKNNNHESVVEPEQMPVESAVPAPNVAGSGELDGGAFRVAMIGATDFVDSDGDSAIRVYYEFTNNFKYPLSAWDTLDFFATQDGNELEPTFSWSDMDVYYNSKKNIRSGITIQCCYEFKYDPSGGNVDFSVFSWDKGIDAGAVTATYDPQKLPGAPAAYVIKPVAEPQWTIKLEGSGTLDEQFNVNVMEAELLEDQDGDPAIRIYYEFTNNSPDNSSLYNSLCIFTYQDGISLTESAAAVSTETDMNLDKEIATGETIKASAVFKLRNETSAVEAEVEACFSYNSVGQTYSIIY